MKKIDSFTGLYRQTKTLRFNLLPVNLTEEMKQKLITEDQKRADDYKNAKEIIDRYLKDYIDKTLSKFSFQKEKLKEYQNLYNINNKDKNQLQKLTDLETDFRRAVVEVFTTTTDSDGKREKNKVHESLFKEALFKTIIPESPLFTKNEIECIRSFEKYTTYFKGFFENRKNLFSMEKKSTAISNRIVNENLVRFLDNERQIEGILEKLPKEKTEKISNLYGVDVRELFRVERYNDVITQKGIEKYNEIIGGAADKNSTHVQGLNELINEYKDQKLPRLKILYKQILSDGKGAFCLDEFLSDEELLSALKNLFISIDDAFCEEVASLGKKIENSDLNGVFVASKSISELSHEVLGQWDAIRHYWDRNYEKQEPYKESQAYFNKRKKAFESINEFSLKEIDDLLEEESNQAATNYFKDIFIPVSKSIRDCRNELFNLFDEYNKVSFQLSSDDKAISMIKNALDSLKQLQGILKMIRVKETARLRDALIYSEIDLISAKLEDVDHIYNLVRNYLTKKPYSTEKIKLNFNHNELLQGFVDSKTETSDNGTKYGAYLFRKKNEINEYDYYLGVSKQSKLFRSFKPVKENDRSDFERLNYYQPKIQTLYGTAYKGKDGKSYKDRKEQLVLILKDFSNKKKYLINGERSAEDFFNNDQATPKRFLDVMEHDNPDLFTELLNYGPFMEINCNLIEELQDTMRQQKRLPGANVIAQKKYNIFSEVMADIDQFDKTPVFEYFHVSETEMKRVIADNDRPFYLFKITNKDLSYADTSSKGLRKSRGTENLHTMYFKELMKGDNEVFDIGTGEIFFRKASIEYDDQIKKIGHHAKELDGKFDYPIIKDKRYSVDSFKLHLSMMINSRCDDKCKKLNELVQESIRKCEENYVVGIDRGERNLIYVCVIDGKGNRVYNKSYNIIENEAYNHVTDYHKLLHTRETENKNARQNWTTINTIKELKEGYLSQVIHEICMLVEKYDAIIVMENLSGGFVDRRKKIEKQVYSKFEKMLTDKLSYYASKKKPSNQTGGILRGYQLCLPESYSGNKDGVGNNQNGFVFYVSSWLTSKIDPVTGFADFLKPMKFKRLTEEIEFIEKMQEIGFDEETGMYKFTFDYDSFRGGSLNRRKKWTIYSNGDRILQARDQNGKWKSREIVLTKEFDRLFKEYSVIKSEDMKSGILQQTKKDFYDRLLKLISLCVQMRNSKPEIEEVDYIISPVTNDGKTFFDSRKFFGRDASMPTCADDNGAFNIARKGALLVEKIKALNLPIPDKELVVKAEEWLGSLQDAE